MFSHASSHAVQNWKQWLSGRLFRFLLLCLFVWCASSLMGRAHAMPSLASSSSVKVETHYIASGSASDKKAQADIRSTSTERKAAVAGKKGDHSARNGAGTGQDVRSVRQASSASSARPARSAKSAAVEKSREKPGARTGTGTRKQPAKPARQARATQSKPLSVQTQGVHAQPWSFGGGRSAAAWGERGIGGKELYQKALPAGSRASAGKEKAAREEQANRTRRKRDSFDLQVDKEYRTWQARHDEVKPDEEVAIDSQHRVRAFAKVQDENVTFGLGPEVIVRDQNQSSPSFVHREDQPDVDAGLGMQFKVDF